MALQRVHSNMLANNFVLDDDQGLIVGSGNNIYIDTANNQVGINTNTTTHALTVNGDISATNFYGDGSQLTGLSSTLDEVTTNGATTTNSITVGGLDVNSTGALGLPVGTTGDRPAASDGQIRFNSTTSEFEGYNGTDWGALGGGGAVYSATAPTTNLAEGDLWFDTGTTGELYVYSGSEWLSTTGSGDVAGFYQRNFTGDNSTVAFNVYGPANSDVFVYTNGVLLSKPADYSYANGIVTFVTAPALNDEISVYVFGGASSVTLTSLGLSSTDDIAEGSNNLYYTDSRVQTKLSDVSGHIIPDTDITYDLGSATNRFRDLYLSGNSITLGTKQITQDNIPEVDLSIAPEVLEIQVSAPAAGQDTAWLWTWEQSTLPYARRTITNSPEVQVPLYKQGTYTLNNYAAYDLFGDMTQTHSLYIKWIDGAGTDNLVSWAVNASGNPISDSHPDINSGNATDVQRINISVPSTITLPTLTAPSVSYTVTNNGSGAYTFSGSASGDNPNIGPFYRGGTYTFNITATGHPLYLTTDNGTNFNSGTYFGEYTDGVTGSRTDSGTLTITVPSDAPDTLYYQCGNHSVMRGAIVIKDLEVETNNNGNYVIYAQHTQEGHKTPIEIRPIPSLVNQMCLVYDASVNRFVPQDLATYVENTPSFENKIREVAGTAELVVEDGSAVVAKVNVYNDSTYLPLVGNNAGDQAFATDVNTLFIWDGSTWETTKQRDTDTLTEGSTNLYYTDARVDARLASGSVATLETSGNVTVGGNLTVNGTTTTLNSTTLTVDDLNITVASGAADATAANGAGLTVDLGSDGTANITYDSVNDEWDFNKGINIQNVFDFDVSSDLLTITNNTNTGGINFAGANSRIYFDNARALEGNASTGNLSIGEGFSTLTVKPNVVDFDSATLNNINRINVFCATDNSAHFQHSGRRGILVGSTDGAGAYIVLDGAADGNGQGGDYSYIEHDLNGYLKFNVGNSTYGVAPHLTITPDGKTGVGYTGPNYKLHVAGHTAIQSGLIQFSGTNLTETEVLDGNYKNHNGPILTNGSPTAINAYGYFRGYSSVYGNNSTDGYNVYAKGAYSHPTFEFYSNNHGSHSGALPANSAIRDGYLYQFVKGPSGSGGPNQNLKLDINNTELVWGITSNDDVHIAANNVGIGTNTPQATLHLQRPGDAYIVLENTGAGQTLRFDQNSIRTTTNHNLSLFTNGNIAQLYLKQSNGNVGINNTNPTSRLQVGGNVKVGSASHQSWTDGVDDLGGLDVFVGSGSHALTIWDDNNQTTPRFIVERAGNVGIGIANPANKLHVTAGSVGNTLNDTITHAEISGGRHHLDFREIRTANQSDWNSTTYQLGIRVDSTRHQSIDFVSDGAYNEHIDIRTGNQVFHSRFTSNGKLGIATNNPNDILTVNTTGASSGISLRLNDTDRMQLTADGTWNYIKAHSGQGVKFNTSNYGSVLEIQGNTDPKIYMPNGDLNLLGAQHRIAFDEGHWYNSVTYHHFKTDIPWLSVQMYSVEILGHEYGASKAVNSQLVWYNYTPSGGVTSAGSYGSHSGGLYQSSDGYVVMRWTFTSGYYTRYTFNQYTTAQGLNPFNITAKAYNNTANHY